MRQWLHRVGGSIVNSDSPPENGVVTGLRVLWCATAAKHPPWKEDRYGNLRRDKKQQLPSTHSAIWTRRMIWTTSPTAMDGHPARLHTATGIDPPWYLLFSFGFHQSSFPASTPSNTYATPLGLARSANLLDQAERYSTFHNGDQCRRPRPRSRPCDDHVHGEYLCRPHRHQ